MRRGFVFVAVCVIVALGFLALTYWPRSSPQSPNQVVSAVVAVEGPIQAGMLVESSIETATAPNSRGVPYVLEASERVGVPEGHVDDVVRELLPRAQAGDARASLALYRKLSECFSAAHTSVSAQEIAIYQALGASAQLEEQSERAQENCVSDGASDYGTRGEWLERAAASGSLEAKLIYATDVDAFFPNAAEMIRDPAGLEEYKRKSVRYMSDLAANGNVDSMMWLARAYENGAMLERNPVSAYAYYRAAEIAMPGVLPAEMLENMRESLPADVQRRGDALARSIHRRCCG